MVKYNCNKCQMEFSKKSNFIKHQNRKFDCVQNSAINKIKNIEANALPNFAEFCRILPTCAKYLLCGKKFK